MFEDVILFFAYICEALAWGRHLGGGFDLRWVALVAVDALIHLQGCSIVLHFQSSTEYNS